MRSLAVLLLCAAAAHSDAEHIKTLVSQLDSESLVTRLNAALRLKRYGPKAVSAAPRLVEMLGEPFVSAPLTAARDALLAIGPRAIPALLKGLGHKNARVVSECALVLSTHEHLLYKHRKALGKALAAADSEAIADLLVTLGPDGVEPLTHALRKSWPHARFAAARGLARLGERGRRAVLELVAEKSAPGIVALHAFPADVALPHLRALAQDDEVKLFAVAGLTGHIDAAIDSLLAAGTGAVDVTRLQDDIEVQRIRADVANLLDQPRFEPREAIIRTLLSRKQVGPLVVFALSEAPPATLVKALAGPYAATATSALAVRPAASLPSLREALADSKLRDGAARALAAIGADAAPALPDLAKLDTEAAKAAHARIHELATLRTSDCKQAIADYRAKRNKPAAAYFEKAATAGNPIAKHYLALMLERKDKKRSARLFAEAAGDGHVPSQILLGDRHLAKGDFGSAESRYRNGAKSGDRVAQYKYAYAYTKKWKRGHKYIAKYVRGSAEQGYAPAQLALFNMLRRGKGVTQDYRAADRWLFKAADQGYPKALHEMYYHHLYGTKDYTEAYAWLKLAAARDPANYKKRFSAFRKDRTNKTRVEGKKRAAELAKKIPVWSE